MKVDRGKIAKRIGKKWWVTVWTWFIWRSIGPSWQTVDSSDAAMVGRHLDYLREYLLLKIESAPRSYWNRRITDRVVVRFPFILSNPVATILFPKIYVGTEGKYGVGSVVCPGLWAMRLHIKCLPSIDHRRGDESLLLLIFNPLSIATACGKETCFKTRDRMFFRILVTSDWNYSIISLLDTKVTRTRNA